MITSTRETYKKTRCCCLQSTFPTSITFRHHPHSFLIYKLFVIPYVTHVENGRPLCFIFSSLRFCPAAKTDAPEKEGNHYSVSRDVPQS